MIAITITVTMKKTNCCGCVRLGGGYFSSYSLIKIIIIIIHTYIHAYTWVYLVVSILDGNYSPRQSMMRDSAVQTHDGKLMSTRLRNLVSRLFREPEGSQCMVFCLWNFQTVGWERVGNAVTTSCLACSLPRPRKSTVDLVTLKFHANKHSPLATSAYTVGPSASSTNSSTGPNPCTALYKAKGFPHSFCFSVNSLRA